MRKRQDLIDQVNEVSDMSHMTVDQIAKTKAEAPEEQTKLSTREIAKQKGIPYMEPIKKLTGFGTLPDRLKSAHDKDWEYVLAIYENQIVRGEPIKFWFKKYPGDPDCLWEIPANRPVYIPRMIAKHLSGERDEISGMQSMVYHTFDYIQKPDNAWRKDDFTHTFQAIGTHYRGTCRAVGAF